MKWINRLVDKINRHWHWQGECYHLSWRHTDKGHYHVVEVAPGLQEVGGGPFDGAEVWTTFRFDLKNFCRQNHAQVSNIFSGLSRPFVSLKLIYKGRKVLLRIHLQPPADAQALEVLDTITNTIRHK